MRLASQDSGDSCGDLVDYLAVLSDDKLHEGLDILEDGLAVRTGEEEDGPETDDDEVLEVKAEEQDDKEGSHFAEEIDDVYKDSFVVVKKKLTALLVPKAVIIHRILYKKGIFLGDDQPLVTIFIGMKFFKLLEKELLAEVQQQCT